MWYYDAISSSCNYAKLHEERLPSLDYRISADYGIVQVARSKSLQCDDLFGSTVNVCAKINVCTNWALKSLRIRLV